MGGKQTYTLQNTKYKKIKSQKNEKQREKEEKTPANRQLKNNHKSG